MPDNILEGKVACLLPGGDGVIRHENNSILVSNVVEGDTVRFSITQKRRGAWRGNIVDIVNPSPQRIAAPCPVAERCGGCALQHLSSQDQAKLKSSWVKQAFAKSVTADTTFIPITAQKTAPQTASVDATFAGRRRVRWFLDHGKLGFRQRNSHNIIPTNQCIALTPSLDDIRNQLQAQLHQLPAHIVSIQAIALSNGFHLIFESKVKPATPPLPLTLRSTLPIQYWSRQCDTPSIKPLHKPVIPLWDTISLGNNTPSSIDIHIGANDFIQGHQQGNQQLIQQVLAWSHGSKRIVDLFSGCGNLSLPLAAAYDAHIIGAELNPNSVQAANRNAQRLQCHASYQTIDLFNQFKTEDFVAADTLIIDPPRKGAKHICNIMPSLFPKKIIMIHCDPAAGARDAQILNQRGYTLQALRPLDLFPYTGHVEVMSLWLPA